MEESIRITCFDLQWPNISLSLLHFHKIKNKINLKFTNLISVISLIKHIQPHPHSLP